MKEKIENLIKNALKNLKIEAEDIILEHPTDLKMGDYSTNVAMSLAKKLKTTPKVLAEKIVKEINKKLPKEIEKIEIAGFGFINFYLSQDFFSNSIEKILENNNFGQNQNLKDKKIIIEYTDPNPFKEFHIGHLMSNSIGESISRIVEWNGAEVRRACYQGDVGMHVAKAVWAIMKKATKTLTGGSIIYNPKNAFALGQAYAEGDLAYRNNESSKKEITEINKKIYNINPKTEYSSFTEEDWYRKGRKISLEYFDEIYKKLGTAFNYFFFESEVGEFGKEIVEKNIGEIFEKGEGGAIIFKAENFDKNLHTRVFINSEGLPTYEAKELGLAKIKYDKFAYDKSVIITGNDINDYFKVLLCAMKQIFPELAEKTLHFSHGMLRLPTGKMSSRTGDVITAESLIEMVKEKVKNEEEVAIGAIKYMILRQAIGGNIIFNLEKSVSTEGDSGIYLQYSFARANSILEKSKKEELFPNSILPKNWQATELEKLLYRFPEVVLRSGEEFSPHYVANYLIELARSYNNYYGNNKIIDKNDPMSPYKIALTMAFSIVLKNGLYLLGIKAPERM
jgi:arginyl-tRNA synthetase